MLMTRLAAPAYIRHPICRRTVQFAVNRCTQPAPRERENRPLCYAVHLPSHLRDEERTARDRRPEAPLAIPGGPTSRGHDVLGEAEKAQKTNR